MISHPNVDGNMLATMAHTYYRRKSNLLEHHSEQHDCRDNYVILGTPLSAFTVFHTPLLMNYLLWIHFLRGNGRSRG